MLIRLVFNLFYVKYACVLMDLVLVCNIVISHNFFTDTTYKALKATAGLVRCYLNLC